MQGPAQSSLGFQYETPSVQVIRAFVRLMGSQQQLLEFSLEGFLVPRLNYLRVFIAQELGFAFMLIELVKETIDRFLVLCEI